MSTTTAVERWYSLRIVSILLVLLIVGYVGASAYLWIEQRELIFFPSRDIRETPANLGLQYEEIWVPVGTRDPTWLYGWWLESANAATATILYLHGNDLNIAGNLDRIALLNRLGFTLLAVDYRGYGKSGGEFPSEIQMYEDADAAWNYLIKERRVDSKHAFIYGHSLGGAVAVELALRHPETAGLIVESTFTSIPEMAKTLYWMFPTDWLLNQRFDALAKMPMLRVPTLFIHGTADEEVPYTMSEQLFSAATGPKWLTLIPGGGHEDSASVGETLYNRAVLDFTQNSAMGNRNNGIRVTQ
ncbi:MAG: lysophospholipase [Betaproteobacteria bacterium]|nr:MAG: lysophospholipase [Betaproteobacteria bacterium]